MFRVCTLFMMCFDSEQTNGSDAPAPTKKALGEGTSDPLCFTAAPHIEESADMYHDHMHRAQNKSENVSTRPQNAPPEGE